MNRRSFLDTILRGAAAFSILPAATTYARTWKKTDAIWIPNVTTAQMQVFTGDGADHFLLEGSRIAIIQWRNAYMDRMADYIRARGINLTYARNSAGKFQLAP